MQKKEFNNSYVDKFQFSTSSHVLIGVNVFQGKTIKQKIKLNQSNDSKQQFSEDKMCRQQQYSFKINSGQEKKIQPKSKVFLQEQCCAIVNSEGQRIIQHRIKDSVQDEKLRQRNILTVQNLFQKMQQIEDKSERLCYLKCDQIINQPLTGPILKENQQVRAMLTQKVRYQQKESKQTLMLALITFLEKSGIKVIVGDRSTLKSQLCMKVLTQGFMSEAVKIEYTMPEKLKDFNYYYQGIIDEKYWKYEQLLRNVRQNIGKQFGIPQHHIHIHKISKGSIKVLFSTPSGNITKFPIQNQHCKMVFHSYFQFFHLSCQDFDPRGNIEFFTKKNQVEQRGGWPYYQPVKCKRYGINVSGKYDDKNDDWLEMYGYQGQWAVAFHGVKKPTSLCSNGQQNVLESMMGGLKKGQMLIPGNAQAYRFDRTVNKPGQKVGEGIYCTPHIQQATALYSDPIQIQQKQKGQKEYRLILQCRVKPSQIKVTPRQQYWVINESKNIRPYGIILLKQSIHKNYPTVQQQFGQQFIYKNWFQKRQDQKDEDTQTQ